MARTRLMPKDHWDWSMPTPFSQGWRVGDLIFVGGQIPTDPFAATLSIDRHSTPLAAFWAIIWIIWPQGCHREL